MDFEIYVKMSQCSFCVCSCHQSQNLQYCSASVCESQCCIIPQPFKQRAHRLLCVSCPILCICCQIQHSSRPISSKSKITYRRLADDRLHTHTHSRRERGDIVSLMLFLTKTSVVACHGRCSSCFFFFSRFFFSPYKDQLSQQQPQGFKNTTVPHTSHDDLRVCLCVCTLCAQDGV